MFYLIGQIAVTLLFTALIGITMGWLLRGLGTSRQTEVIEARWRARIAQLERRSGSATGAAEPAEVEKTGSAAAGEKAEQQIADLQNQVRQRDELLASLRSPQALREKPGADSKDLVRRLRETTELCRQLQQSAAEQTGAADQVKDQLQQANSEREMLIDRLRDRESEIGRMSQERQHAINTIASLQKEMRKMRGERHIRAGAAQSGAAQSGTAQSGAAQSGAAQSGAAQSGAAQSGAAQSGAAQSGAAQSRAAQSRAAQSRAAQSGAAQSGAAQSGAAQSGAAQSGAAQSGAAQSGAAQSGATPADTAKQAVTPPSGQPQKKQPVVAAGPGIQPAPRQASTSQTSVPASKTARTADSQPKKDTSEPVIQQDLPIAGPEIRSTARYEPPWRLSAPQGPKDNLQAIFGIGPKLEMQLNRLGIFHFEQIGRFQRNDILWVAHHLKSFPGRIVRDRWIEQAQTLANQKRH